MPDHPLPPFLSLRAALREFVTVTGTQAQQHIRPIHRYAAIRLVLEGGFDPDEIIPHPPLCVETRTGRNYLRFDTTVENAGAELAPNDIAVTAGGEVVSPIRRYHDVLLELAGRRLVRDEITRYQAVAIGLVVPHAPELGSLRTDFPTADSPLQVSTFFETLYATYDLRFPYIAASVTSLRRIDWDPDSPALKAIREAGDFDAVLGYSPRLA